MDKKETYLSDFSGKIRIKQSKRHRSNPYSAKNRKKNVNNENHDDVEQMSSSATKQVGEIFTQFCCFS